MRNFVFCVFACASTCIIVLLHHSFSYISFTFFFLRLLFLFILFLFFLFSFLFLYFSLVKHSYKHVLIAFGCLYPNVYIQSFSAPFAVIVSAPEGIISQGAK